LPLANVTGDLRSQILPSHLDTAPIGPPREGRWAGTRPEITPARALAIREKRAYEEALKTGVFDRAAKAEALIVACHQAQPLLLAQYAPVLRELCARTLRLFSALLLVHKRGHEGVLLTHAQMAECLGASVSSARRSMATLLGRGYVMVVAPDFERHGAASSRRGNVYAVPGPVLASIEKVRALFKLEQASGTALGEEYQRSGSRHRPPDAKREAAGENAYSPSPVTPCAQVRNPPTAVVESAARTVDFIAAAPAAASVPAVPVARQVATRSAAPEAQDGDGFDEMRRLAAEGNAFAVEMLATLERDRLRRERIGGVETFEDVQRARSLEARQRLAEKGS
jgi:hypothetical protein